MCSKTLIKVRRVAASPDSWCRTSVLFEKSTKESGRPGEMNDKRPETVFGKGVSWSPTPQKSRAMVGERVGGITAFGEVGQGRVCQS